jgi:exopolyphosphatase/pppGpp-phosphohydrolase
MDHRAAKAFILAKLKAELPVARTYHSLEHTLDVYASAIDIGEREGVGEEDMVLLRTAALFHDAGFLLQDLEHEEASCRIVREHLPQWGFSDPQIERICNMIMATRIPQTPHDKLSRILCDADLDYLGRGDFFQVGEGLFLELKAYGVLRTRREWNELQDKFLSHHHYHTRTNKDLREPAKQEHLEEVRRLLREGE